MNMISTAFPIETDASNKPESLAKKFASVWEKKNSKTARAGGVSLMALSLAACGAEDETPFAQSDIDAATAPISASLAAAQTQAATALVAQATAETQAATALVAQAGAEASAAAALVAQATAETTAATMTVAAATATAAKVTAEAALVVAQAAKVTAETDLATAQASLATETAAKVLAEGSLATTTALYNEVIAPRALSLTNSATVDTLQGGPGDDAFTGAAGTLIAGDAIRDASALDNDTLTITDTDSTIGAFTVQNVENVNININSLTAQVDVDANNYSGVTNLTITRGDIVVGGATLTGATRVDATNVNANNTAAVTAGGGTTIMNVTQQLQAGVTVNANEATGAVSVVGAALVNASGMGLGDTLTVTGMTTAQAGGTLALQSVQNAKAVTIDTAAATVLLVDGTGAQGALDGVIGITAAAAGVVTVPNAAGGVTVAALGSGTNGVDIRGVDASGVNVTTTFAGTAAAPGIIDLGAIAVTGVIGTVKANGFVALDTGVVTDSIDTLNLQSNGAAVTYTVVSTNGALTTVSATSDVTVAGTAAEFSGVTISGSAAAVNLASTSGAGVAVDADGWSSTQVGVAYNNLGSIFTAAQGQNFVFTQVQTGLDFDYVAAVTDQDITITAGDVNGTSSTIGDLTLGTLNVTSGTPISGTVAIIANDSNVVATSVVANVAQDIVITGDENVNLGTVASAKSVNSQGSTGVITMTAGLTNQSITTGSGADQLTLSGNVVHTVDSGAGIDALTITSTAPTSTIDGGSSGDTFTLTDVDQYVVIGGSGADTFNVGVASGATIIGGSESDTLTFTAAVTLAAGFTATGVEKVNIAATGGTTAFSITQFSGLAASEITSSGTDDSIQITALAGGSTIDLSSLTIASGSTPNITAVTGAGADTFAGSAYGETINMNDLTGADDITGGSTGIDAITTNNTTIIAQTGSNTSTGIVLNMGGANVTAVNVLSNLAGNNYLGKSVTTVASDTMAFIYGAVDTLSVNSTQIDSITGIENFTSTDAAGVEYIVGTSGANVISVGAGADYVDGGAGADTIILGADTVIDTGIGGDGSDSFVYGVTANFAATSAVIDSINGGASATDAISIDNNGLATFTIAAADDLVRITNVEQVVARQATGAIMSVSLHADANIDGFDTVDFSNDTTAAGNNIISVATTTVAGVTGFTLTGGAGIDTITGGIKADTITGGSGNDIIQGNAAEDTIVGGIGADDILYIATTDGGTTGDVITGFVSTSDDIIINGALETAVDIAAGAIVASAQATAGTVLALQLETAELFFMSTADNLAETASVTAANLGNLTMVAALVDEATTQSDANAVGARTILIAIQASDAITSSGLYTYTQSSATDVTYGANEFTHLATITSDTLVAGDITV